MRMAAGVALGVALLAAGARGAPLPVEVTLEAERADYVVGEPVLLKFRIKNITDKPVKINFGGDYRGGTRASRFTVTATDEKGGKAMDPDPVQIMFGGLGGDREITPGASDWMPVAPLRYCLIDKAGTYKIRVSHDLGLSGDRVGGAEPATGGAADFPTAEITLTFKMPDAQQAQKIVDEIFAVDHGQTMVDSKPPVGAIERDFSTLRLPVYLPALEKYARDGKVDAVAGIGSIETPEATALLIDLLPSQVPGMAQQAVWPLNQRLPLEEAIPYGPGSFRRDDKTGRYAAMVKAAWRPENAAALRTFCLAELKNPKSLTGTQMYDSLGSVAGYLEVVGEKEDAPAVYAALEAALTRDDVAILDGESPPRNVGSLVRTARALMARGAGAPEAGTPGAVVVEIESMRQDQKYRPEGWQDRLPAALGDKRPYIRQMALLALGEMPEPLPEGAVANLTRLLATGAPATRAGAMQALGKTKDAAIGKTILEMLKAETDPGELRSGGWAVMQAGLQAQWLSLCAQRLNEKGLWDIFAQPLFGCLDGLSGGGTSGPPSAKDAAVAQELWVAFVAKHAEELAAGKKIPLDQADGRMAPPPYKLMRTDGGEWPKR